MPTQSTLTLTLASCTVLLPLLLACALQPPAAALHTLPPWARGGELYRDAVAAADAADASLHSACTEHTIEVPWDHDVGSHGRQERLQVRYWVDDNCAAGAVDAPIFLRMGGEAAAGCWNCPGVSEYKAITVAVEHRGYGESVPAEGLSPAFLPFLTTPQNLADTAAIVRAVNPDGARKVIVWGGSYSGGTASWFRAAHPDITDGAISSSGVVNAIVDFQQFDTSITSTLAAYKKFPDCLPTLVAAIDELDSMSPDDLQNTMRHPFNASNLARGTPAADSVDFGYMVADAAAMAIQYGRKDRLCELLAADSAGSTPVELLASAIPVMYGNTFQSGCFYDRECVRAEKADPISGVGYKAWRWQKCSLLGYIQTRPVKVAAAARSRSLTLNSQIAQCKAMFPDSDLSHFEADNAVWQNLTGADRPDRANATKIVYKDFSDDPWKTASVQGASASWASRDLTYCFTSCDGCGHCGAGVPMNLTHCDDVVTAKLQEWLQM